MARDYSSRRNNPPDKNGKRKSAKRPTPAARPVRSKPKTPPRKKGGSGGGAASRGAGAPGCIWLLCALLLGVAGVSVYYIASRPAGHGPESVNVKLPVNQSGASSGNNAPSAGGTSSHGADKTEAASPEQKKNHPRFSFYKMLPNYKVEVPAGQQAQQPITDNKEPHEVEPSANTPAPSAPSHAADHSNDTAHASTPSKSDTAGPGYVIQAGAFSTEKDADHRKAQLALLGVTADIVDVRTSSGKTVYRVQSNTLESSNTAHSLAQRLQSHGIETMVRHTH
ncbi:SPOR domain-containing protein [Salinisphaera sp. LB1]|uniref:SPOR domain-containing protein n=1 Tax=Salinisphaera sp. LB1 TaxID=2183911 RepID=UPI000D708566|nr:SPOR domain-containing protein [Salinisphaera sp. LB1]AWN15197.1 Cell division protein [Salinisphaera sp. LB1]